MANSSPVVVASNQSTLPVSLSSLPTVYIAGSVPVTGTFWQTVQPVSLGSPATISIGNIAAVSQNGTWNIGGSSNSALADGTANPTTNLLGSMNELWNGSTWDRVRSIGAASGATGVGVLATGSMGYYASGGYVSLPSLTYGSIQIDSQGRQFVQAPTAIGSAVPANAFYMGINNGGGTLTGLVGGSVADAISAPSATLFTDAFEMVYNGTTWDRQRGIGAASGATLSTGIAATGLVGFGTTTYNAITATNNSLNVNLTNSSVAVTGTFYQTTQPVSLSSLPTIYIAGTLPVSVTSLPSIYGQVAATQSGTWNVGSSSNSALADGTANPTTNLFGSMNEVFNGTTWDRVRSVGIASGASGTGVLASGTLISTGQLYEPVTGNSTTTTNKLGMDVNILSVLGTAPTNAGILDVDLNPQASGGGWAAPSVQNALTNSVVNIKTSAGKWGGYMFYNPNASAAYIQLFSVFASNVSLASYAQYAVIPLPAGAAANVEWTNGTSFPTALSAAATANATGSTTPGTALTGFFLYK